MHWRGLPFEPFRELEPDARARFLETIADRIQALGDELLERGHAETGLPIARLTGERGRTMGQLRLFADELRKGGWLGLRVDPALPDRKPLPRSDLRQRKVPLGPVVVFGASNFPLAFSVAGGDTAAALAAGCPVIVKGHSAHPGTSDLVAQAVAAAVKACDLPPGVFSLLNGNSRALGAALVAHPHVKAVGFTGSRAGGLALMKIASERPEPIPVYAEMSSINPVFLLPAALADRAEKLGQDFVGSLTLGVGSVLHESRPGDRTRKRGSRTVHRCGRCCPRTGAPGVMLTSGIHAAYEKRRPALARPRQGDSAGARRRVAGQELRTRSTVLGPCPRSAATRRRDERGVRRLVGDRPVRHEAEMLEVAEHLEGQLTATLHLTERDEALATRLLPIVERKAGRLIANGWPTGVEVAHAMVHGGPFPATSTDAAHPSGRPRSSDSCGRSAIRTFRMRCCRVRCAVTSWSRCRTGSTASIAKVGDEQRAMSIRGHTVRSNDGVRLVAAVEDSGDAWRIDEVASTYELREQRWK